MAVEKSSPKIWPICVVFKNLRQENNRPMGENSADLVTLSTEPSSKRDKY
jgi:hypothetical protein